MVHSELNAFIAAWKLRSRLASWLSRVPHSTYWQTPDLGFQTCARNFLQIPTVVAMMLFMS